MLFFGISRAIHAVVEGATDRYWEDARPDVEEKTKLPREISPGAELDLLLVFRPPGGKSPGPSPLKLDASLTADEEICEKGLTVYPNRF